MGQFAKKEATEIHEPKKGGWHFRDYALMEPAIIIPSICTVLGQVLLAAGRHMRERREDYATARGVLVALYGALTATHAPQMHPSRPVVVPFTYYAEIWKGARKTLARKMTEEELGDLDAAFEALAVLQKCDERGTDLRDEVYSGLPDAGVQCEIARRVVWKHSQRLRDRARRLIRRKLRDARERWELRNACRAAVKLRKQREHSLAAGGA